MVNILTGEMLVSGGHLPRRLWLDVPKGFHFTECDSDPIGAETAWSKPRGRNRVAYRFGRFRSM